MGIIGVGFPTLASAGSYRWAKMPIHGGGFVRGLAIHPTEPETAAGSRSTTSSAASTTRLWNWAVALDPHDPDRAYLACGQYVAWWAHQATVLRSTDRGATWPRTTLPFNPDGNSNGRNTGIPMT